MTLLLVLTGVSGLIDAVSYLRLGLQNATVRRIAVPDLTTTVLNMTLTGLAADGILGGGSGAKPLRRGSVLACSRARRSERCSCASHRPSCSPCRLRHRPGRGRLAGLTDPVHSS
ncbi:MAG TPA: hypothetical protein VH969_18905 [Actinophytocola sp.]|uniref:hypothetical protein n=1 Tax=Actinophytocola sp. TaxID=1872138 RepID=UPI002F93E2CB